MAAQFGATAGVTGSESTQLVGASALNWASPRITTNVLGAKRPPEARQAANPRSSDVVCLPGSAPLAEWFQHCAEMLFRPTSCRCAKRTRLVSLKKNRSCGQADAEMRLPHSIDPDQHG